MVLHWQPDRQFLTTVFSSSSSVTFFPKVHSRWLTVTEWLMLILVYLLFGLTHCVAPCLIQFGSVTWHVNIHRCNMFLHPLRRGFFAVPGSNYETKLKQTYYWLQNILLKPCMASKEKQKIRYFLTLMTNLVRLGFLYKAQFTPGYLKVTMCNVKGLREVTQPQRIITSVQ